MNVGCENMISLSAIVRAVSILGVLVATSQGAHALTKVKAGHLVALDMAPLFLAKEGGCFEKYGLDVETVFFANPGDNNAALAGGEIDFSTNPFTLPFFAANAGVPIRTIAAAGGWGIMQVIADGKLNIRSVADLKKYIAGGGKKLKFASLQGDTLELILTRIFKANQIPEDSVEIVNFDDLLAMVDAFRSGQVDVLSHIKPYTTDFIVNKGATLITDNTTVWSPHTPNTVVSVLDKTLRDRPEIVEAYLKGLYCAATMINKDPEAAVKILTAKNSYYRVSPQVLLEAFKNAPEPISFVPDLPSIQSVVDDLSALGYIKGKTKAADIFRLDMMKKIEAEK
jgi:ABC-type nitrate/sulfonate/bicarbonate transport system substrate-binding protein